MLELLYCLQFSTLVIPLTRVFHPVLLADVHRFGGNWRSVTVAILLAAYSFSANAVDQAIVVDYLHGESDLSGIRLAYRPYHDQITGSEWFADMNLYW